MRAGVDVGATNLRAAVAEGDTILGRADRPTPDESGRAVTNAVMELIQDACADASRSVAEIERVGVASIGPLDRQRGCVVDPVNLPGVAEIALVHPLSEFFECAVFLCNDATAGVLGERAAGAPANTVYLTISTGIGAGVCVDGHVLSGWGGNAGEVGHFALDPDGALECGCGGRGHWEAYCSGSGIPRYARRLHDGEPTALAIDESTTAADVFACAREGDAFAERVVERVGDWNARGVATVVHAYAPEVVSVGGAVALENPERTLDPIRERLPDLVVSRVPDVRLPRAGADVVLSGALSLAARRGL